MAAKSISFTDGDKELVERIRKFQEEQRLNSFIAAVRMLCNNALEINK